MGDIFYFTLISGCVFNSWPEMINKCKIQIKVTGNVITSTKEFMFLVAFAHHFVCKHETF